MPTVDVSIIDPGKVDSKAPLKKSTVAWAVGICIALAMVAYYLPGVFQGQAPADEKATAPSQSSRGSEDQIKAEIEQAATAARTPPAVAAPTPQPQPSTTQPAQPVQPAPMPERPTTPQPYQAPASNQSNRSPQPEVEEMDAAARVSKSVALDSDFGTDPNAQASLSREDAVAARMPKQNGTVENINQSASGDRLEQILRAQASAKSPRDGDRQWLKEFSEIKTAEAISPKRIQNPYTLIQGKVIPAVLGKSLNSNLPGDITAFTTVDIYDSLTSSYLLVPKGSMLIGEYSNSVRAGQGRLMFAFSRIVLPNGITFDLPGNKGQDGTGASGIPGDVNNHYFLRFTSAFLIAIMADRLESGNTQPVTNIGASGPSTAAGKVLSEVAQADLARNRDIAPTITVPQGTRINVQVAADMEFPGPYRKR